MSSIHLYELCNVFAMQRSTLGKVRIISSDISSFNHISPVLFLDNSVRVINFGNLLVFALSLG